MIKDKILKKYIQALKKIGISGSQAFLEDPKYFNFGDYSGTAPLKFSKQLGKSPINIAKDIKNNFEKDNLVEKVEIVKPGFINFWINKKILYNNLSEIINKNELYGKTDIFENKKVLVEFTDPNPFKEFHIGHLYSNIVGESLSRIHEFMNANVKRANYQGDIGLHVAKSIYGMQKNMKEQNISLKEFKNKDIKEKVNFMGKAYVYGANAYDQYKNAKEEIIKLNKKIYELDNSVKELYELGRKWSLQYFEYIYKRLGTKFDFYYFESDMAKIGLKYIEKHIKSHVFEESKGAIIFKGEKYGLHTRVFINSQGLPTYEAKDLGLISAKYNDFPYDLSLIITGNEIKEYFKVILKALEIINPELGAKTHHITHGMVKLKEGKMSSRTGNIITGEELIDKIKENVFLIIKKSKDIPNNQIDNISEKIALSAIKYSFLKVNIGHDITFDFKESLSLEGNSGPYLQYTYVRCKSVLNNSNIDHIELPEADLEKLEKQEINILRRLYKFPEIVIKSGKTYFPNLICNYLYLLAQEYNFFYQKCPILKADKKKKLFRLALTKSVGIVLKNGLYLLGIKTVDKM